MIPDPMLAARAVGNQIAFFQMMSVAIDLDGEFTFDGGELTFTLKLKRRVIDQLYGEVIERLYAQPAPVGR